MNEIKKTIAPLINRVRLLIGRGIVRLIDDSKGLQEMQVTLMKNETRSSIERFQNYGLTSKPLPGAEAAVMFLGGSRDHGIIIAVDDRRYRLKGLESGEVALYTDEGDNIILKRNNTIEVNTTVFKVNASQETVFNTPILKTTGDIIDNHETNSITMKDGRDIYNGHDHGENGGAGPTDKPNQLMGA